MIKIKITPKKVTAPSVELNTKEKEISNRYTFPKNL